ncbi:CRISPR-associated protein Cas1 [Liquorilactobacillus sucicola DSM 21376 = JCM 15457]|nr:type I-B CRISPR-associated endonuclease Cas1b [Liquorilactobacillus sucicola]GAJ25650.1 CRISPR-associated protein Cas1 [Liquorilactobacillus sucicola DSM 21376 = JCM 15457]
MESFYLFSSGELKRKDNVIRLNRADGAYKDIKIEVARDIFLFGEVQTNTKCLNYLSEKKIPVHFFNYYGFYTGTFYPREKNVSGTLLIKQVLIYEQAKRRLGLAQKFVSGATYNCLRNLKYYLRRDRKLTAEINQIETLKKIIPRTESVTELMGIEGDIHRIYYGAWQKIFNKDVDFDKRVRRPPNNMVNALISFLNMMAYSVCLSEIYVSQLNPTISYLHTSMERRFSLCLDISEIFKPLLVDRIIFSLINRNVIKETDFETGSNYCYMKSSAMKKVTQAFDEYLQKTVTHRSLGRKVSYRRMIRLECYKLIKDLMDEKEYVPFQLWW